MDNTVSYSIAEAADALKLSGKTIRRYIKAGKLPATKVSTKFGDEYRITAIPESLRQEAEAQARAQGKVEVVPVEEPGFRLDAHQLYQDNIRLALQLGAANARIHQLEDKLKLLEAPQSPAAETSREPDEQSGAVGATLEVAGRAGPSPAPTVGIPWWKRLWRRK